MTSYTDNITTEPDSIGPGITSSASVGTGTGTGPGTGTVPRHASGIFMKLVGARKGPSKVDFKGGATCYTYRTGKGKKGPSEGIIIIPSTGGSDRKETIDLGSFGVVRSNATSNGNGHSITCHRESSASKKIVCRHQRRLTANDAELYVDKELAKKYEIWQTDFEFTGFPGAESSVPMLSAPATEGSDKQTQAQVSAGPAGNLSEVVGGDL